MSWAVLTAEGKTDGRTPDFEEVRRAVRVLCDPAHGVEIQGLPSGRCKVVAASDLDAVCRAVEDYSVGDEGVYYTLNPVPADLGRPVKVPDVLRRIALLIDLDRAKEPGTLKLSATDEEKEKVRVVSVDLHGYLSDLGWPAPVLIDSGNGFHQNHKTDEPNDDDARGLFRDFLKALAFKFDTPSVQVDTKVHNANRVSKLPGTWARKGPDTADRPHRPARLLYVPEERETVTKALIADTIGRLKVSPPAFSLPTQAGASAPTEAPPSPPPVPFIASAFSGADDGTAYARRALDNECVEMAMTKPGGLNEQLYSSGAACGNFVPHLLGEQEVFDRILSAAQSAGANDPRKDEDTLRRAIAEGMKTPRWPPGMTPPDGQGGTRPRPKPTVAIPDVVIIRASEVVPKKVRWLWPWRIPLGKLTTFAGIGGLGKTFVLCDMAARVSRGVAWPEKGHLSCEPGEVLFISGEDDPDDTLVPRMMSCGADLDRIAFLKAEVCDAFTLKALEVLSRATQQVGPNTRLVVIDPPSSYLGGVDDHKNAELRALLSPLKTWAAERSIALVFNNHLNKGSGQKVEAMMRVMGSVAWVNAVRAAHLFTRMPDDPTKVLFVPMKNNLAPMRTGLVYRIVGEGDAPPSIEWLGETDVTADAALNKEKKKRRVAAADWLLELFDGRNEVASKEVFDRTKAETDVSDNALKEAKADMRIQARQKYDDDGNRNWWWTWTEADRAMWMSRITTNTTDEVGI